ncbi:MAG TPA: hypothetical protein VFM01_02280 [Nakamurella sp.]|nr:hypothetical protein [Nakamurella sp.]
MNETMAAKATTQTATGCPPSNRTGRAAAPVGASTDDPEGADFAAGEDPAGAGDEPAGADGEAGDEPAGADSEAGDGRAGAGVFEVTVTAAWSGEGTG